MYYTVRFTGKFGFIKPWTAVRDGKTYSQQFLTPSIVEGIEKKLFPELLSQSGIKKICGYKLSYDDIDIQQEQVQTRGWKTKKNKKEKENRISREQSIINRGVMLNPVLIIAFANEQDAILASRQHICLCRNEDLMLPDAEVTVMSEEAFSAIPGFELKEDSSDCSFLVGFNRFDNCNPMYGKLEIDGKTVL